MPEALQHDDRSSYEEVPSPTSLPATGFGGSRGGAGDGGVCDPRLPIVSLRVSAGSVRLGHFGDRGVVWPWAQL